MKRLKNSVMVATLCLWLLPVVAQASRQLIPVGQVVGLELRGETVTVAAFDDVLGAAAREAGLQIGDEILDIDGIAVDDAEDVKAALARSDGQIELRVLRDEKERKLCLAPAVTEEGPRLGVFLRQGVTGIGTVTWYDPQTNCFGTLGHGVNDPKGDLIRMTSGRVYEASVLSVKRGQVGEPGQLRGGVDGARVLGSLSKNTNRGVFGSVDEGWQGTTVQTASADEIQMGPATICSTVEGNTVREYSVEILKLYPNSSKEGRNMLIRVTDPVLLTATGGIVQGMSGSPIIQNGKLVGAVTHVLVNDPQTGYGIFIENMLEAAD